MRLYEAVETGRPFRRADWTLWYLMSHSGLLLPTDASGQQWQVTREDQLADDYIIDEPAVKVTYTSFWTAYEKAQRDYGARKVIRSTRGYDYYEHGELINSLCHHLGLDEHLNILKEEPK